MTYRFAWMAALAIVTSGCGGRTAAVVSGPTGDASAGRAGTVADAGAEAPVRIASGIPTDGSAIDVLEANETSLYFGTPQGVLATVPITGGAAVTIEPTGVSDFAATPRGVVYAVHTGPTRRDLSVRRRADDGRTEILTTATSIYAAVAARGDDVAYALPLENDAGIASDARGVIQLADGGKVAQTVRALALVQILLDGSRLYVVGPDTFAIPRDGSPPRELSLDGLIFYTLQRRGFAQDAEALYFRSARDSGGNTVLRRFAKDGSGARDLSPPEPDLTPVNQVTVDADYVYYATAGQPVRRVPKSGGAFEVVDSRSGDVNDWAVAVNSTYVFWVTGSGEIWRRKK